MRDLSLLNLFVQVADLGSFSAAARSINATPSAVSRKISRLEDELGSRLFQRTTRRQQLTEAGETYLRHARQIIEDLDAAHQAVSSRHAAPSGILRITAEADLANSLLSPLLPEFLQQYPELQLRLITSASMEDLVERRIDIAIRMGHLTDSSLLARRITMSRSLIVASPSYLSTHDTPQEPQELSQHSCLSFRAEKEQHKWSFRHGDDQFDVPISGSVHANSLLFIRSAAISGLGLAMLPSWFIQNELESGQLVAVLPGYPLVPPATPINIVFPSGRNLASKTRVFIDFLTERLKAV